MKLKEAIDTNVASAVGIPDAYFRASLSDCRATKNPANKSLLAEFCDDNPSCRFVRFSGEHFTGKTYTACGILNLAIRLRVSCKYYSFNQYMNEYVSNYSLPDSRKVDILVMDNIHTAFNAMEFRALEEMLNYRLSNKLRIIIIFSCKIESLPFPESLINLISKSARMEFNKGVGNA